MTGSPYDFLFSTVATAVAWLLASGINLFIAYALSFYPNLDAKLRTALETVCNVLATVVVSAIALQIPQEWLDKSVLAGLIALLTLASNRGAALFGKVSATNAQLAMLNHAVQLGDYPLTANLAQMIPKAREE